MFILDMVHHNPGEPRYQSAFNDPAKIASMGYNGKVYSLFESPILAVDWNTVLPGTMAGEAEEWRQELFSRIKGEFARCKAHHLQVLAMSDLVLLPRSLVEKDGMLDRFGNVGEEWVQKHLRLLFNLVFTQFPELDGLVVRIGETYLNDAPYHVGKIDRKNDPSGTIIPLINLLREELCVKRNKTLVFRTWGAFDENLTVYKWIADSIEPHPRLVIAVKHCEEDFHRGNPFSKIIGFGNHRQLIEVQCAREYEGKGAYPNYLAHGIIDGFEEHFRSRSLRSVGEFVRRCPEKFAGIWTWSRGGGWEGPYIKNELWPDINAWILAQWCADPSVSEERLFADYCRKFLEYDEDQTAAFRRLCLMSEKAIVRGKASLIGFFPPWWSRDQYIGLPPRTPYDTEELLAEKHESVRLWSEMLEISRTLGGYVETSTRYGWDIYRIYEAVWNVTLGNNSPGWHRQYEDAWEDLEKLAETHPDCATLYERTVIRRLDATGSADSMMETCSCRISGDHYRDHLKKAGSDE